VASDVKASRNTLLIFIGCRLATAQPPNNSELLPFNFNFIASRNGELPNIREYSRLNWDALWYPTLKAEPSALSPSSTISRLASSKRRRF